MSQLGFFEFSDRFKKLDEKDPLVSLKSLIDWENFRDTFNRICVKDRKSNGGRKPFDVVTIFEVLVLQHLYNILDDQTKYQIRDRYSFCRFLRFTPLDRILDAKTIWLFREHLVKLNLIKELFNDFNYQLDDQGYKAKKGQIVDASFVDTPKQIKAAKIPDRFIENSNVGVQKDTGARWTKKNNEVYLGYKNHVTVDNAHKFILGV